jgi:hypothetical protein
MGIENESLEQPGTQIAQWNAIVNSLDQIDATLNALCGATEPDSEFGRALRDFGERFRGAYGCANDQLVASQRRLLSSSSPELSAHYLNSSSAIHVRVHT